MFPVAKGCGFIDTHVPYLQLHLHGNGSAVTCVLTDTGLPTERGFLHFSGFAVRTLSLRYSKIACPHGMTPEPRASVLPYHFLSKVIGHLARFQHCRKKRKKTGGKTAGVGDECRNCVCTPLFPVEEGGQRVLRIRHKASRKSRQLGFQEYNKELKKSDSFFPFLSGGRREGEGNKTVLNILLFSRFAYSLQSLVCLFWVLLYTVFAPNF